MTHTFKPGDKIRTVYGEVLTVAEQIENVVFVQEGDHKRIHATKAFLVGGGK